MEYHGSIANGSWTAAADLAPGDLLLGFGKEWTQVLSKKVVDRPLKAYNLSVDVHDNYFVRAAGSEGTGVWVHNCPTGDVPNNADESVEVFRVFGGDARAQGFSFTTVDPRTVNNFRDAAGLPSGGASGANNTADFLLKGTANKKDIIKSRDALPLDGNSGGLPELIIDPSNVDITDFSVLRP